MEFLASKDILPNNKVSDFVFHNDWNFPQDWKLWFLFLCSTLSSVSDTNSSYDDILTWIHKENGILTLKDAYLFKAPIVIVSPLASKVWCADIPLRKTLLVWKIIHAQISTDDLVMSRGIAMASRYYLCDVAAKNFRLFVPQLQLCVGSMDMDQEQS